MATGNGVSQVPAVIQRMTKHYAGLRTAVLTVKMNRSLGADGKVDDERVFGPYHVYFQSPNLYGNSLGDFQKLSRLPKSQVDSYGSALIDPAFGYLIIFPQLFQGFQIADTFPKMSYRGQESLGGDNTDVVVLQRDLPSSSDNKTEGANTLTLWVNARGQLRRFELALMTTVKDANLPSEKIDYTFRGEISEAENGPLPSSFLKKAQPKKPTSSSKGRKSRQRKS
jgi:hypothetical protein